MNPYEAKAVRTPHGAAGTFSGWFTHTRGAMISRRTALRVLIFGPRRGRIEIKQSKELEW